MSIILITLSIIVISAIGIHFLKRFKEAREDRMSENEYNAAALLWNYSRIIKAHIDEVAHKGTGVLDYARITVPHGQGYRISLELSSYGFRVFAVPERYNRTGRLSLYADNSLIVRANDCGGQQASENDPVYEDKQAP